MSAWSTIGRLPASTAPMAAAVVAIGAERWLLRARVPDSYDAFGFQLAVDQFDLERFSPHFPGYPVYVALARAAHWLGLHPLEACEAVSALAGGVTAWVLFRLTREVAGERAAFFALALYGGAALPCVIGGSALSDGTAVALAALALWTLAEKRTATSGLLIGLLLGARISYAPIALSWLLLAMRSVRSRSGRFRALGSAVFGVALWAVPFCAVVGVGHLVALGHVHLVGHFTAWGGTMVTRPGEAARLAAFARDFAYDGFAPTGWALALLGLAIVYALRGVPVPSARAMFVALLLAGPYALWVLVGQNILEQPRHLLPLVVMAMVPLGALLASSTSSAIVAVAAVWGASLPLAVAHALSRPAAAQAAEYVAAKEPGATIYAGASARFFAQHQPPLNALEAPTLADVDVSLARLDRLPDEVLVTSELATDPRRAERLRPLGHFCRDPRLDRASPCLDLYLYRRRRRELP